MRLFFLLLLCNVFCVTAMDMDVTPAYDDPKFLRWCGALTCKEIERKQVINMTPRQFLRIDETNINMEPFDRPRATLLEETTVVPQETVYEDNNIRDRRLGGRWRRLEDTNSKNLIDDYDREGNLMLDLLGRYHREVFWTRGDSVPSEDELIHLFRNSIPYEGAFYLYGGACADRSGKLWITADSLPLALSDTNDKKQFPVRFLWVEKCKKPFLLHEHMLPAQKWDVVQESVAVKFTEDDTQFELYYDASGKKVESMNKDDSPGNLPSLWVVTFALDRVQKYKSRIDSAVLEKWCKVYWKMKTGMLPKEELLETKQEMCALVDGFDRIAQMG